jgi:hypothetical protein
MLMMIPMMGSVGMVCLCIVCLSMLMFGSQMMGTMDTVGGEEPPADDSGVPRAPDGCVYLFEDKDGQGTPLMACLDGRQSWSINDFGSVNDNYHDKATIMDVGKGVSVKLYEHPNFNLSKRGRVVKKTRPEWVDLSDIGFDNKASSLRIRAL